MVYHTTHLKYAHAPCLRTRIDKSLNRHVQMYRHDMLVSKLKCMSMHIHTNTHRCTHTDTRSLSRESACEFCDTGEEKCKCSSLQVSDMTSMGRWMSARVRERRRWWRERDLGNEMVLVLCVFGASPPALTHFAVKEHACLAAKIDVTVSGGYSFATKSSSVYVCFSFLFSSIPLFRRDMPLPSSKKNASYAAYFPFSQFPSLQSSSPWVPCCSSCIVRLQVVWELDL